MIFCVHAKCSRKKSKQKKKSEKEKAHSGASGCSSDGSGGSDGVHNVGAGSGGSGGSDGDGSDGDGSGGSSGSVGGGSDGLRGGDTGGTAGIGSGETFCVGTGAMVAGEGIDAVYGAAHGLTGLVDAVDVSVACSVFFDVTAVSILSKVVVTDELEDRQLFFDDRDEATDVCGCVGGMILYHQMFAFHTWSVYFEP